MPDTCSFEQGALAEPLSVVLHGIRRTSFRAGQRALIIGAGAVGLLACIVAKAHGAAYVLAVDIDQAKIDFAATEGLATAGLVLPRGARAETPEAGLAAAQTTANAILSKLREHDEAADGFDLVIECSVSREQAQRSYLTYPSGLRE